MKECGNKENLVYINVIENYCTQIHNMDSDANKFRYPMAKTMQVYFSQNKRFDFIHMGDFLEALNNILDSVDTACKAKNERDAELEVEYCSEMGIDYYTEMMAEQ